MTYSGFSTQDDVFKELLIQGAELTEKHNFPVLFPVDVKPKETVSFSSSFKKSNTIRENLNFYEHDKSFISLWNSPDRYIDHLAEYGSICMPDYTIAFEAPYPQNLYNKYRSHALAYWLSVQGITVIPHVSIMPEMFWDWIWEGIPKHSTICCTTNGRVKTEELRRDFCAQFTEMCRRTEPDRCLIYGRELGGLKADCEIVYLPLDNMKTNKNASIVKIDKNRRKQGDFCK